MKNTYSSAKILFIMFGMVVGLSLVNAGIINAQVADTTAPHVVINGPTQGNYYSGDIHVNATITDTNLRNYHFRVIKEGGAEGHTCTSVFAPEEQGYASTTLSKTACNFVYNDSQFVSSPAGFTNTEIATLHAADLIAYAGEGNYVLILGAVDFDGNRTSADYLQDPRVTISVGSTTPVVPDPTPTSVGGAIAPQSGGGYSGGSSILTAPVIAPKVTPKPTPVVHAYTASVPHKDELAMNDDSMMASTTTTASSTDESATSTAMSESPLVAAAAQSGFTMNWWLILIVIVLLALIGYIYRTYKQKNG